MKLAVVGYLIRPFEFSELLTVAWDAIAGKGNFLKASQLARVLNAMANDLEGIVKPSISLANPKVPKMVLPGRYPAWVQAHRAIDH